MPSLHNILVIDDNIDSGQLVGDAAEAMGLKCVATTNAVSFLENLSPTTTLIFLDLVMPDIDGIELLRILGEKRCTAGIVLMTGVDKRIIETAEEWAMTLGLSVVGHLQKPFRLVDLEKMFKTELQPSGVNAQKKLAVIDPADLKRAIELDEFVLHFQPQIDIASGEVLGLEALVRWQHPERGLIFPDDFISLAEELGLIDQLGWIVTNRGLAALSRFSETAGTPLMLSINVSAYSLHDLKFPDTLLSLLEKYGISAEHLIFEITESGLIQELSSTLDVLTRLRMKRVQLSIDDFGTGFSMLRQLRRIPATELKIDKSFVQRLHVAEDDRVLVQKTIEIGHGLGMRVVAEGVETDEQLNFLRLKGCDVAQGYLFSRPLPADELVKWLVNYKDTCVGVPQLV